MSSKTRLASAMLLCLAGTACAGPSTTTPSGSSSSSPMRNLLGPATCPLPTIQAEADAQVFSGTVPQLRTPIGRVGAQVVAIPDTYNLKTLRIDIVPIPTLSTPLAVTTPPVSTSVPTATPTQADLGQSLDLGTESHVARITTTAPHVGRYDVAFPNALPAGQYAVFAVTTGLVPEGCLAGAAATGAPTQEDDTTTELATVTVP